MVRPRFGEVDLMKSSLLSLLLGLGCGPALAEPFVLLIHETPAQIALRGDSGAGGQAYWAAFAEFGKQAAAAGILRGGAAMMPVAAAHVGQIVTRGELPLGGFFLIDVTDAAAAADWAAKLPSATTGGVEVRATIPAPGM